MNGNDRLDRERSLHRSGGRAPGQKLGLPILLALGIAWVQSATPSKPAAPDPAKPVSKDEPKPTASEILERAITAQGLPPTGDAAADVPPALRANVNLQFTSKEGDVINVNAERRYLGEKSGPGYIWTRAISTSNPDEDTILAFDGKRPWFWSKAAAHSGSGLRWLDEPGGEQDLAQLDDDLRTTALMTRALLLRNLASQWRDLKRLDDETWVNKATKEKLAAWVIQGTADVDRAGVKKPVVLKLYIEQKTDWLFGAGVAIEGEAPLQICFTKHEKRKGVIVPGKIEIYVDREAKPRMTLFVVDLELAPKLAPKDFAPPG